MPIGLEVLGLGRDEIKGVGYFHFEVQGADDVFARRVVAQHERQ
jgi:hypothetical protein